MLPKLSNLSWKKVLNDEITEKLIFNKVVLIFLVKLLLDLLVELAILYVFF